MTEAIGIPRFARDFRKKLRRFRKYMPGLKPEFYDAFFAALKGRSFTLHLALHHGPQLVNAVATGKADLQPKIPDAALAGLIANY
jgi:hypothetical protein